MEEALGFKALIINRNDIPRILPGAGG